jgi:hypothetical protein
LGILSVFKGAFPLGGALSLFIAWPPAGKQWLREPFNNFPTASRPALDGQNFGASLFRMGKMCDTGTYTN